MSDPLTRTQFKIKLREIAERHKVDLTVENFSEELFDIVVLERTKARLSHSDKCDGRWRQQSEFPEEPGHG